MSGMHI